MDWNEYKREKMLRKSECNPLPGDCTDNQFACHKITNKDEYDFYKKAIQVYEDENFELTYDDYAKMEECFEKVVEYLKYKDDDLYQSDIERIVDTMAYLNWEYWGQPVTQTMLFDTLRNLFEGACEYASTQKIKRTRSCGGGWTVIVDFEQYKVEVYFSLFSDSMYYEDVINEN